MWNSLTHSSSLQNFHTNKTTDFSQSWTRRRQALWVDDSGQFHPGTWQPIIKWIHRHHNNNNTKTYSTTIQYKRNNNRSAKTRISRAWTCLRWWRREISTYVSLSLVFWFLVFCVFFHNKSYHSLDVKFTHSLFLAKMQLQTKQQISTNRQLVDVNLPALRTAIDNFAVRDNPSLTTTLCALPFSLWQSTPSNLTGIRQSQAQETLRIRAWRISRRLCVHRQGATRSRRGP